MARTHGTTSGYASGCRCDDCREATRLSQRLRRHYAIPRGDIPEHERAWMETEPEYFHERLRAKR